MTKASSFILRLYFAVVSAVTLFTLMFGSIDLLTIGLKSYVITAANVPEYLENCSQTSTYSSPAPIPVKGTESGTELSVDDLRKMCEDRNTQSIAAFKTTEASQAVRDLALVLITLPLFMLHFKIVYRDWVEEKKNKE